METLDGESNQLMIPTWKGVHVEYEHDPTCDLCLFPGQHSDWTLNNRHRRTIHTSPVKFIGAITLYFPLLIAFREP